MICVAGRCYSHWEMELSFELQSSRLKLRTPVTSFASCPIKLVLGLFDDFSDKNILKAIIKLIHMLE